MYTVTDLLLMPWTFGSCLHPFTCLDTTVIELVRREAADVWVHSVLGVQHLHRIASCLQPFEQRDIVAKGHCTLGYDCCWQLNRVTNQEHLQNSMLDITSCSVYGMH